MHWCLAYADMRKQVIYYLDSLGGNNQVCQDVLLEYLRVSPFHHLELYLVRKPVLRTLKNDNTVF